MKILSSSFVRFDKSLFNFLILSIILGINCFIFLYPSFAKEKSNNNQDQPSLYQLELLKPEPNGTRLPFINPPTFRWPKDKGPYEIEISQKEDFSESQKFSDIEETFYRPLQPIDSGHWFWRIQSSKKQWSPTLSFDLPENATRWPMESWNEALKKVPETHPRIWIRPEQLQSLRDKARGPLKSYLADCEKRATRWLNEKIDLNIVSSDTNEDSKEKKVKEHLNKDDLIDTLAPAGQLAFLYLITQKDEYAKEAKRRVLMAAALDPDGPTSHKNNDFGDDEIILDTALVYDYLYSILTAEEKSLLSKSLKERCQRTIQAVCPAREQILFNPHQWQRVILSLNAGALAIYDEDPMAKDFFEWSLKMYVANYPWFGGKDGGCAEGCSYYTGVDMLHSLWSRDLFFDATGIDLAMNPWFKGDINYLMYSHSPGGVSSKFGDNHGSSSPPDAKRKLAALRFASLFNNGFAQAYADAIEDDNLTNWCEWVFKWSPFKAVTPPPLDQLPKASAFLDIGVVFMHSAIANPSQNIFFEFKSSPYGSYNHAHADQNSFNINVGGKPLIVDSGFYTAFRDEHHGGYTVTTKAHNAILVDGKGQTPFNLSAYGEITDFEQNSNATYFKGSCPNAYQETPLTRADRHVLWLQPDTYVIADDLAATDQKPHQYDWLLHSLQKMKIDEKMNTVLVENEKGRALIQFLYPKELKFEQHDGFDPAPKAWLPEKLNDKFPDEWHLTATPIEKQSSQKFLAVIQIATDKKNPFPSLESILKNSEFQKIKSKLPLEGIDLDNVIAKKASGG
jgi:hypothetical protein